VDDFGMVKLKHESRSSDNNLLFAHQAHQVYYLSYPYERMKHWWAVYKVNPEMYTRRYDAYVERHNNDDVVHVYQEENEGLQSLSFTVSDGVRLAELATCDVELMEEESCPSKKRLQNQNESLKNKKGVNGLMHVSLKQIHMLTTFGKYNLLLLYDNNHYIYIYLEICC
jgi:hypothetical protein